MVDQGATRRRAWQSVLLPLVATMTLVLGVSAATAQSDGDDPADLLEGREVFNASCAGCHGADGMGSESGRPLTDIATQQPDRLVHIASVTNGKGGMPAFGDDLSEEEIDAAISYVRLTFVSDASRDELPNTGFAPELFLSAGALLAAGFAMLGLSRRRTLMV